MTRAKTAEDVTKTEQPDTLVADLYALATAYALTADRADNTDVEDTRRREATQIRFVAALTPTLYGWRQVGEAWLTAGRRMLARIDAADMDAVHASRAGRRA